MKKWFTIAGALILMGGLMFTMTGCAGGWHFGGKRVETSTDITEGFSNIDIITDTYDITLAPSQDGNCRLVTYGNKKITHTASVEDGTLKIHINDSRKWFERIFGWYTNLLTLYLPEAEYASLSISEDTGNISISGYKFDNVNIDLSTGNVTIQDVTCADFRLTLSTGDTYIYGITCSSFTTSASTGDISVNNITASGNVHIDRSTGHINVNTAKIGGNLSTVTSTGKNEIRLAECAGNLEVNVSTGKSLLSDINCANLASTGDTGDIGMSNVIASGQFSIKRETGDVSFDRCDAAEIYVTTDTGDVTGTFLSEKIFQVRTDTGKVNVPESWSGGKCKIETDTGDIKISVE